MLQPRADRVGKLKTAKRIFGNIFIYPAKVPSTPTLLQSFLLQPRVFAMVSYATLIRASRRKKSFRETVPDDPHLANVHEYTTSVITHTSFEGTRRMEVYYRILCLPPRDLSKERLLVIGPKNDRELILAQLYGYRWKNIQGIDLFSMHPKILVMDMDHMSFSDGSFDAVVMANVYGYQQDPIQCLREVSRVLRPGGRFVFNTSYNPNARAETNRIPGKQILDMLRSVSLSPYYYWPADTVDGDVANATSHVFGMVKRTEPGFDRAL